MQTLTVYKENENAVIPMRETPQSVGMDLTAISVWKTYSKITTVFDTGLIVTPPEGYCVEIYPRSSISKSGYMLANSIGVIDPDYTQSLKIALTKIDSEKPDLVPPFKICQILLKEIIPYELGLSELPPTETKRTGGFGSTDMNRIMALASGKLENLRGLDLSEQDRMTLVREIPDAYKYLKPSPALFTEACLAETLQTFCPKKINQ